MITLKDAPGGLKFAECLAEAVDALSLFLAGKPDDRARSILEDYIGGIEAGMIEAVGAGKASVWLNAFRGAVMARKHQIEATASARSSFKS